MDTVLLLIGVGLTTIGLLILMFTPRLRARWGRPAVRNTESVAAGVSPAPPQIGVSHTQQAPDERHFTIDDMAEGLAVKASELAKAAVVAVQEEARVLEGDARGRSEEIVAQAEDDAQQIRQSAAKEAQRTVRGAMHAASHFQSETRALTDSAKAEISSSVTALNELLATLSSFDGVDREEPSPIAAEPDRVESEPESVARSVKDDVRTILANFNYLRRAPEGSPEAHDESAVVRNGTPG